MNWGDAEFLRQFGAQRTDGEKLRFLHFQNTEEMTLAIEKEGKRQRNRKIRKGSAHPWIGIWVVVPERESLRS